MHLLLSFLISPSKSKLPNVRRAKVMLVTSVVSVRLVEDDEDGRLVCDDLGAPG